MASLALGVRFTPAAGGTTDFLYASTVTGYRVATSVLVNSKVYRYRAESADLSQWEYGTAIWSSTTGTLSRNTITDSSNSGAKVNFTAAPQVAITIDVPDVLGFDDAMALTTAQQAMGRSNLGIVIQGHLFGLTLSTAGSSATFSVAAGQAADSTAVDMMTLAAAISKTTSAWAVGSGNGSLDTGTIANSTWYHVHLIKRPDTGVVDVLVSLSATSPTMPANYTTFRRIGSMKTDGSAHWIPFTQAGDEFHLAANAVDVSYTASNISNTNAFLASLSVPTGVQVEALCHVAFSITGGIGALLISCLDENDIAAISIGGSANATVWISTTGAFNTQDVRRRTNTSGQIRYRSSSATSGVGIFTYGWIDTRGRLS